MRPCFCAFILLIISISVFATNITITTFISNGNLVRESSYNNSYDNFNLKIVDRPFRVLISLTNKYFSLFLNWLIFYRRSGLKYSQLFIICFDENIEKSLPRYGLQCSIVFYLPTRTPLQTISTLWQVRARMALLLLENNTDVLMSDTDALWVQNPIPELLYLSSLNGSAFDIISSRAQFPEEIAKKLGATLCMGFMYIKASSATESLWRGFYHYTVKLKSTDDQRDLNTYLARRGLRYSKPPKMLINTIVSTANSPELQNIIEPPTQEEEEEYNNGEVQIRLSKRLNFTEQRRFLSRVAKKLHTKSISKTSGIKDEEEQQQQQQLPIVKVKIVLLPHAKYRRTCHPVSLRVNRTTTGTSPPPLSTLHKKGEKSSMYYTPRVEDQLRHCVVAHCPAVKRYGDGGGSVKRYPDLWMLRARWKAVPVNGSLDSYLHSISVSADT